MIDEIAVAHQAAVERLSAVASFDELRLTTAEVLGKRGELATLKTRLGSLPIEDRKVAGGAINQALAELQLLVDERERTLRDAETLRRIAGERLDLTEITSRRRHGHPHLATQAWERLEDVFIGLGFQIAEGPEVETDFY